MISIFDNHVKNKKYRNCVFISSLTGECAAEKFKNFCSSSLWTCLHHMVILRSQNKITDFLMILAWACPLSTFSVLSIRTHPGHVVKPLMSPIVYTDILGHNQPVAQVFSLIPPSIINRFS